jgi:transcriptional regulator with XRE-family HTH domain|tara:strand:+ start:5345 stop:5899 length:555 start_codon:yes stop_codon:yes gene_type:complete
MADNDMILRALEEAHLSSNNHELNNSKRIDFLRSVPKLWSGTLIKYHPERLLEVRKECKFSRKFVCDKLKEFNYSLSTKQLESIEKGKSSRTNGSTIYWLAKIYGVDKMYLSNFPSLEKKQKIKFLNINRQSRKRYLEYMVDDASTVDRFVFKKKYSDSDPKLVKKIYDLVEDKMVKNAVEKLI